MRVLTEEINYANMAATFIFMLLISYFTYHAISGERGLLAFIRLSKQVEDARINLDNVVAEKLRLEHRVTLLRDDSLDLDLLDEQARKLLGYSDKSDIIYMPSDKKKR
jgi:cell division protein FtsB